MAITDYTNGAARTVSGAFTNIQGALNGQPSAITSYLSNLTGLKFLQPKGLVGIGGFLFDTFAEDSLHLAAEITDHWAEDNAAIQDHSAIAPIHCSLSGYVGEYVLPNPKGGVVGILNTVAQKMGSIPAYLGKYTPGALQKLTNQVNGAVAKAQNYVNEANQYLNQAQTIASLFKSGNGAPNKQQAAYATLSTLLGNHALFNVVTPWTTLQNMMIESVDLIQPENTPSKTEITVSMKQIRVVPISGSETPASTVNKSQGRAQSQRQPLSLNGSTPGTPTPIASLVSPTNPLNLSVVS